MYRVLLQLDACCRVSVTAADASMIRLRGVLRLALLRAADLCRNCLISSILRCTSIWAVLNRLEILRVNVSLSCAYPSFCRQQRQLSKVGYNSSS